MKKLLKKTNVAALACISSFAFCGAALAVVEFDQDATPDVIFGSGNANGAFTTDRNDGVEIALRSKLRFNGSGLPENTFNSNGDGTYSFNNIVAPTKPSPTAEWGFEWSVNTDYDDSSAGSLDGLTYELGLDGDPGLGTDFLTFDPITPTVDVPSFDHAIGDNSTGNGDGVSAAGTDDLARAADYAALIAANNVAQNSWRYTFFNAPSTPLESFDPTNVGLYDIYLLARNAAGDVVARSDIRVLVGLEVPTDKNDCKKGGWKTFDPILGFKNQGKCVSFVNTGK